MKTPMQELIERLNNVKPQDFCSIETIKGWAKELLDKEKEAMCEFAEYVRKCGQQSDHRGLMTNEELFDETFNTKEK